MISVIYCIGLMGWTAHKGQGYGLRQTDKCNKIEDSVVVIAGILCWVSDTFILISMV